MFVKKKARSLKKVNLDVDDRLVEVGFQVSNKDREKLREEAFRKKVSQGNIMRRILKDHFEDEEKRRKDLGVKLETILDSCGSWFGGFEIEFEGGFINKMRTAGLELNKNYLSDVQRVRVKKNLLVGFRGYDRGIPFIEDKRPSRSEFAKKFDILNPDRDFSAWLKGELVELEEEVEKDLKEVEKDLDEEDSEEVKEERRRDEEYKQKHGIEEEGEDFEGEGEGEGEEEDLDEEGEEELIKIERID